LRAARSGGHGSAWAVALLLAALAVEGDARDAPGRPTARRDERVVRDRLHAENNPHREDDSFLSGVGAVWPADLRAAAAGWRASTGFLIDPCHVLTSQHGLGTAGVGANSAAGGRVAFGVGQTPRDIDAGALLGFAVVIDGRVIATGGASIVHHAVVYPARDWALIRLTAPVGDAIAPLEIHAVAADLGAIPRNLAAAGYPTDHRSLRPVRAQLKDLWGSDGVVVDVLQDETGAALIGTTIQATRGQSGGPVYGDLDGRRHLVIGMIQGYPGNGIDAGAAAPNIELLFTQPTLSQIESARSSTPCQ
jgi:hypothetical protein